tara:strand:- start:580 stop:723 length:144 start_codon:yes stop_codon:yes gene_type:complete
VARALQNASEIESQQAERLTSLEDETPTVGTAGTDFRCDRVARKQKE